MAVIQKKITILKCKVLKDLYVCYLFYYKCQSIFDDFMTFLKIEK